jgi:hypothetical protein
MELCKAAAAAQPPVWRQINNDKETPLVDPGPANPQGNDYVSRADTDAGQQVWRQGGGQTTRITSVDPNAPQPVQGRTFEQKARAFDLAARAAGYAGPPGPAPQVRYEDPGDGTGEPAPFMSPAARAGNQSVSKDGRFLGWDGEAQSRDEYERYNSEMTRLRTLNNANQLTADRPAPPPRTEPYADYAKDVATAFEGRPNGPRSFQRWLDSDNVDDKMYSAPTSRSQLRDYLSAYNPQQRESDARAAYWRGVDPSLRMRAAGANIDQHNAGKAMAPDGLTAVSRLPPAPVRNDAIKAEHDVPTEAGVRRLSRLLRASGSNDGRKAVSDVRFEDSSDEEMAALAKALIRMAGTGGSGAAARTA